jgi:hypothetical protein
MFMQMFALCGNRTRDPLRSRRVFPPLRHIGRQIAVQVQFKAVDTISTELQTKQFTRIHDDWNRTAIELLLQSNCTVGLQFYCIRVNCIPICSWITVDGQCDVVVGMLHTTQEVTGSIPAQCKHLCAWTRLFALGLGVSMYNMYAFTKKKCI